MTITNKRSFGGSCCCGNPAGMYPDDCERCELIARIKHLETLLQRLTQSMRGIHTWSTAYVKHYQSKPREWWIEQVVDIEREASRVLKACEKEETGHE